MTIQTVRRRILFVVNHAGFFLSHRLPLALAAREAGYDVAVATPRSKHVPRILDAGIAWHEIRLSRSGRNPIGEARSIASLARTYRKVRPDLVHQVTPKVVLYGTPVARMLRVPAVVNAISGMGHVFSGDRAPNPLFQRSVAGAYRIALKHPHMRVIFQNREQREMFLRAGWVREPETVFIPGSGVDAGVFHPVDRSRVTAPVIMLVSRMLYTKGVLEFVEAARILRAEGVHGRFVLVGEPDPDNLASVPEQELRRFSDEGAVEYWGRREDMPAVWAQADIACLPTFYPEGTPKALIEAAACGLPIVATDWPGCREIVRDGENGFLVPIKDAQGVAAALRTLIADRALREEMGRRGRAIALNGFTLDAVVALTLAIYRELLG
jgi:glycosyltransferase involved in cell wall biosynthesis